MVSNHFNQSRMLLTEAEAVITKKTWQRTKEEFHF